MSDAMSTYLENALINGTLRNTAYSPQATVYVALYDTTASLATLEASTHTGEIVGNAYARTAITFDAPAGGVTQCTQTTFPQASGGNWGLVRYAAICEAATAGNILYFGQLQLDKQVDDGDTFRFNAGDLTITLS